MAPPTINMKQVIAQADPESALQRRSALLQPLNMGLIVASLVGLAVMPFASASLLPYVVVCLSLAINLLVFWLNRSGRAKTAPLIFCIWVNVGTLYFAAANFLFEANLATGILFACVLAMSVMLAGMLLGVQAAFMFATVDSIGVFALLYTFMRFFDPERSENNYIGKTIAIAVPTVAFIMIIAVISWLYQRALAASEQRLELARQRIMADELLRRDLAIARELQQRLYPPPPLTNAGLSIASRSEPARETSGDFYDFIELDDERLGIVVADVTGKSIAAALVMAMSRGTLRSEATRHRSPAAVLSYANQTLCQDRTFKQMITAFYGVLDTRSLRLDISNAGHPFPVIRRNGQLQEIEICGLPLGARTDAHYVEQSIQLEPGDQLVIISDGIIEERNSQRELFGFERMLETIAAADSLDSERALDEIWQAVTLFRGASEQSDDITLVVVQVAAAYAVAEPSPAFAQAV